MQFTDEWLVPTMEKVLAPGVIERLRLEAAREPQSLWTSWSSAKRRTTTTCCTLLLHGSGCRSRT